MQRCQMTLSIVSKRQSRGGRGVLCFVAEESPNGRLMMTSPRIRTRLKHKSICFWQPSIDLGAGHLQVCGSHTDVLRPLTTDTGPSSVNCLREVLIEN
jgi:hypothetical protein